MVKTVKNPKKILVTGAGTGIGRDAVLALATRGHQVVAATYSEEQARALSAEAIPNVEATKIDITDAQDRKKVLGLGLNVLINNAGIGDSGSLAEVDIDRIRRVFEVNLFATLTLSQIVIREMVGNGGGTVLFVSSIAGRLPVPFLMPYSMSKFALSAASDGLREEMDFLGKKVHVSVIEPGAFRTGFNQAMTETKYAWMEQDSLFSAEQISKLRAKEEGQFKIFEARSTSPIIKKIVRASEAKRPRRRYVAPWTQGAVIRMARILGR